MSLGGLPRSNLVRSCRREPLKPGTTVPGRVVVAVGLEQSGSRGPASGEETALFVHSAEATWSTPGSSRGCVRVFPAPLATSSKMGFLRKGLREGLRTKY